MGSHTPKTGFSLIDTLLGVGIFLVVTVALIQFTLTTQRAADNLSMQVRAQNSAREGIEIMENIRGTNALTFVNWVTPAKDQPNKAMEGLARFDKIATQNEVCAILEPNQTVNKAPWIVTVIPCPQDDILPPETELKEGSLGRQGVFLNHTQGGQPTGIFRFVRIRLAKNSSIPALSQFWSQFVDTRQNPPKRDADVVEVESVVRWSNYGQIQELTLRKILADWFQ